MDETEVNGEIALEIEGAGEGAKVVTHAEIQGFAKSLLQEFQRVDRNQAAMMSMIREIVEILVRVGAIETQGPGLVLPGQARFEEALSHIAQ